MDEQIPVSVVHGSRLIREGLADLLGRQNGVRMVGAFASIRECFQQPLGEDHVLLCDLVTAHQEEAGRLRELYDRCPQAKLLIFNVLDDDETIIECVRVGASGCILQDASMGELLEAVRSVWRGTPAMSPRCNTSLFQYVARLRTGEIPPLSVHLTRREAEILELIAEGLSNKEIAQRLYLQPQTVKNYVHMVLQKLEVHSRLEAIRLLRAGGGKASPHRSTDLP